MDLLIFLPLIELLQEPVLQEEIASLTPHLRNFLIALQRLALPVQTEPRVKRSHAVMTVERRAQIAEVKLLHPASLTHYADLSAPLFVMESIPIEGATTFIILAIQEDAYAILAFQ